MPNSIGSRASVALACAAVALLAGCQNCDAPDPEFVPCEPRVITAEVVGDACTSGALLASGRFDRARGGPEAVELSFETEHPGELCVHVRNGSDHRSRISSAVVALDGEAIFGPSDFNRQVARLEARRALEVGPHVLTSTLRSAPGSFLDVEVRQLRHRTTEEIASLRALDDLRVAHCHETNFRASQLTPEELIAAGQLHQQVEFPPGQLLTLYSSHGVPILIAPLPWDFAPEGLLPEGWALDWLEQHRALFMVEDPRVTFASSTSRLDPGNNHQVVLHQLWQGVPISPGFAELRFDSDGNPLAYHGRIVPVGDLPPSVVPSVDASAALATGLATLDADDGVAALVIRDLVADGSAREGPGTALQWSVFTLPGDAPLRSVWVDATTGTASAVAIHDQTFHLPDAVVSRATSQVCDFVGAEPVSEVTAEARLYSRLEPPTDLTCGGDATCLSILDSIHSLDETLISMRRGGWSNHGADALLMMDGTILIEAIPGSAPYRVLFDVRSPAGSAWRPTEHRVRLHPAEVAPDIIWHEFGHGLHQAERNNAALSQRPFFVFPAALSESFADSLALLVQDHVGVVDLAMNDGSGASVRDHAILECSGYGDGDLCDIGPLTRADVCDSSPYEVTSGCREYTRLGLFADERFEIVQPARIPVHASSCALTRPLSLLLDDARDGTFVHGVEVDRMPPTLSRLMYTWLFSLAALDNELPEFEAHLWMSVLKLGQECPTGCGSGENVLDIAQRAYWAAGFFTPPFALDPSGADYAIRGAPAAVFLPGPVEPSIWLVYAEPGGGLRIARLDRPFRFLDVDPETGAPSFVRYPDTTTLRVDGPQAIAADSPAIALDPSGQQVFLAYRRAADDRLVVARVGLGTEFNTDPRFAQEAMLGSPTIAAHGGRVFVAYVSAATGRIEVQHAGTFEPVAARVAVAPEDPVEVPEHDPFLASDGLRLVLVTAQGPRAVCDPVMTEVCLADAHALTMRTWLGADFTPRAALHQPPVPYAFEPPLRAGNLIATQVDPTGAPALTFYGDRFQAFFPAFSNLEIAAHTVAHFTFAAGPLAGPAPGTVSRMQGRPLGMPGLRVAPVVAEDPAVSGSALLVFANSDGRIVLTHKRSTR